MQKIAFIFITFLLIYWQGYAQSTKFISFNNQHIRYMGRVGINDSCAEIYWTGTSIRFKIAATTTVKAMLSDENGNNYYDVIVDGDSASATKIRINKEKQLYTLADKLDGKLHRIELCKITNTDFVTTRFYGIETDSTAQLQKPDKLPKRKIEFFGNSITCGHGVEEGSHDSGAPEFFNNYRAYGGITARHFNAQYHCTSKSGIGVAISWFNEVMPDIYDRLNPADSNSKWDFSQYIPDIVVINLFQNDSWLLNRPEHEQFKKRFGTEKPTENFIIHAYLNFLKSIRSKYPKAQIVCCLGNMDATAKGSKWPGYIDAAVQQMKDKKITTHFFPYKNTPGHPSISEQKAMATNLIDFIEKKHYWK